MPELISDQFLSHEARHTHRDFFQLPFLSRITTCAPPIVSDSHRFFKDCNLIEFYQFQQVEFGTCTLLLEDFRVTFLQPEIPLHSICEGSILIFFTCYAVCEV